MMTKYFFILSLPEANHDLCILSVKNKATLLRTFFLLSDIYNDPYKTEISALFYFILIDSISWQQTNSILTNDL